MVMRGTTLQGTRSSIGALPGQCNCRPKKVPWVDCPVSMGHNGHGINLFGVLMIIMGMQWDILTAPIVLSGSFVTNE